MTAPKSLPITLPVLRALAGLPEPAAGTAGSGGSLGLDRRELLRAGGALLALAAVGGPRVARALDPSGSLFALGVASGDPTATSVVLWTRLAPDPLAGGGMDPVAVPVQWQVARDPGLQDVVRSGEVLAEPAAAHSVHVTVSGLEPDRWYWYRFVAQGEASRVGRTRTFPAPGVVASRLRFGLASCQNWQAGLFSAYHDMVQHDLDLVVHVGDYIYEGGIDRGAIRQHDGGEVRTLAQYRNRHALYKLDPWLQEAHARFPFVVTWDDHEVDNNYADEIEENGAPVAEFLARRAAAYQAYYEHMPLLASTRPNGPDMRLYRAFDYGRLARLNMLDTRQYRTDQPCNDLLRPVCPEVDDPAATLVGRAQEQWLLKSLFLSRARWNVMAQQVMMTEMDYGAGFGASVPIVNMDGWDGYTESRRRILEIIARYRIQNAVVLTGDIHTAWAADLKPDFRDPKSPVIGSEFVGTSITSGFPADIAPYVAASVPANPHIKFFEGTKRGWVRCEVTPTLWRSDYRGMTSVTSDTAPAETRASFVLEHGRPGLQPA